MAFSDIKKKVNKKVKIKYKNWLRSLNPSQYKQELKTKLAC